MSMDELKPNEFDKLWDYSKPKETETKFQEFRPKCEAIGDLDLLLQLDTQIARTYGLRGEFGPAHEVLDVVEEQLESEHRVATVRYLLERGRSHNSAGDKTQACQLFLDAFTKAKQLGEEFHMVDAAHMLGIAQEPSKSLEWNEKAISIAERAKDRRARGWLGALLNNTGWTYHDLGDHPKALELFEQCLVYNEQAKRIPQARIAKWTIARTYRSMQRFEEALSRQEALAREYADAGDSETGFVSEEIGECLWALGRKSEARHHLAAAHEKLHEVPWIEKERLEKLLERSQPKTDEDSR